MSPRTTTIPLRSLPTPLPSRCDWITERDAQRIPILAHHPGDTVVFAVHAPAGARLRGSVRLAELTWRDAFGHADVSIEVEGGGARWTARLFTANAGHPQAEQEFLLDLPPTTDGVPATVRLTVATRAPRGCPPVNRVFWRETRLEVEAPHVAPGPSESGAPAAGPRPTAPGLPPRDDDPAPANAGDPLVSIVMPVCDPTPELLRSTLASVHAQSAGGWELCITDDCSTDPAVLAILDEEVAAAPDRIVVQRHATRQNISAATNTALAVARGRYVVMLDHDDLLHPDAVLRVTEAIEREDPDVIYSDDEIEFSPSRTVISHKPGFSLDMIRGLMYTHHLSVYRRSLLERIGGLRSAFDGSQDYDMMLRLLDLQPTVHHIPQVLYTWRAHAASMAGNPHSKPLAYARGLAALNEHVERSGVGGTIVYGGHPGRYRHLPAWPAETTATIVVAIPDGRPEQLAGLRQALSSWHDDRSVAWTLVVGTTEAHADAVRAALEGTGIDADAVRVVTVPDGEPELALVRAAQAVRTDVALLLHRSAIRLSAQTLRTLGSHALLPDVHAVGLRIIGPAGRLESTGLVLRDGAPQRLLADGQGNDHGPSGIGRFTRAVTALDDVVVTTRADLERLGGLDPEMGALALADYCLRGNRSGTRTVFLADLLAGRPAIAPVDVRLDRIAAFAERWVGEDDATVPSLTPLALSNASPKTPLPSVGLPA